MLSIKLRDERATWEREQTSLKDRINELTLKLQAAEAAAHPSSSVKSDKDLNGSAESILIIEAREEELNRHRKLAAEGEKKVAALEEALSRCQHEAEEVNHKLQMEKDCVQKVVQALEGEKKLMADKQTSSHELISRMKTECMALRSKLKEVENDYRALQSKHRDIIQHQEEVQLEREEAVGKLKYMEQDYAVLAEKLDKEKENHVATARELHKKCNELEKDFTSRHVALQQETRAALAKALRELHKSQKKRDAYKRKCLEIHEKYKHHVKEVDRRESKLLQDRQEHAIELRQLLAQLSEAESEKTVLMQRQIELGYPPPTNIVKKLP